MDVDGVTIEDANDSEDDDDFLASELNKGSTSTSTFVPSVPTKTGTEPAEHTRSSEKKKSTPREPTIYADGAVQAGNIVLTKMNKNLTSTLTYTKEIKQVIESIFDELKDQKVGTSVTPKEATGTSNRNRKSSAPSDKLFDTNKKKFLDTQLQLLESTLTHLRQDLAHIQLQNFNLLEENTRRYYVEPRFTQAGSGIGYGGTHYSLNVHPVNASVFYSMAEALETETSPNSVGGVIYSSAKTNSQSNTMPSTAGSSSGNNTPDS
jgi:hypothetical protein